MTNDEIRRNEEIRRTKPAIAQLGAFGHSGFGFHSSFVIRHSTTHANQVHGPNACAKSESGHEPVAADVSGSFFRQQSEPPYGRLLRLKVPMRAKHGVA